MILAASVLRQKNRHNVIDKRNLKPTPLLPSAWINMKEKGCKGTDTEIAISIGLPEKDMLIQMFTKISCHSSVNIARRLKQQAVN